MWKFFLNKSISALQHARHCEEKVCESFNLAFDVLIEKEILFSLKTVFPSVINEKHKNNEIYKLKLIYLENAHIPHTNIPIYKRVTISAICFSRTGWNHNLLWATIFTIEIAKQAKNCITICPTNSKYFLSLTRKNLKKLTDILTVYCSLNLYDNMT